MPGQRLTSFVAGLLTAGAAAGGEPSPPNHVPPAMPCRHRPAPGQACWAQPSDTGHYVGYWVGGGCLRKGDPPTPDEGTWGWDYGGCLFPKRVYLLWCHC